MPPPPPPPTNPFVSALFTDLYQITMCYAYFQTKKHLDPCVFELFFRSNPFDGEYTVVGGIDEVVKHLYSFQLTQDDIDYLRYEIPSLQHADEEFWKYLQSIHPFTTPHFMVRALPDGTIVFPRIPILIVEAPLGLGQLLETTLLNLINFPSLITTNASRMVLRANPTTTSTTTTTTTTISKPCIEFGLRRAQGPDGAMSASKYSYLGGFVATSNVLAGKLFQIPVAGTHAHSFVQSFMSLKEVEHFTLFNKNTNTTEVLLPTVLMYRTKLVPQGIKTNDGELAAFCAYAISFPESCLCLIDTYDTLSSGIYNFCSVALALYDFGYVARGIRLDSGDLLQLSLSCQQVFYKIAKDYNCPCFNSLMIVASNDINEEKLVEFQTQDHGITAYGIGTNLVTCQKQPALGCVYKLVEWKNQPRIKLSQDLPKVTIPGKKKVYRLYDGNGKMMLDVMTLIPSSSATEEENKQEAQTQIPQINIPFLCRDPFSTYRCFAVASQVTELHQTIFQGSSTSSGGRETPTTTQQETSLIDLSTSRDYLKQQLETLSEDVKAYTNPKKYPVMVSQPLYDYFHSIWEKEAPIDEKR